MIDAISPIDGRYRDRVERLSEYFSEAALQRKRTQIEVEYLLHLADIDGFPLTLSGGERADLVEIRDTFDTEDAELIKRIETDGWPERDIPATNHDVKAVEYFIRERAPDAVAPY
ncbi:MAG: adenylosuccinate lyase, partial [Candidatus Nanohaloarchaea archaeon]